MAIFSRKPKKKENQDDTTDKDDVQSVVSDETVFDNSLYSMGLSRQRAHRRFYRPTRPQPVVSSSSSVNSMKTATEGLVEDIPLVFNRPADSYNFIRDLPIVAESFRPGVLVFSSDVAVQQYRTLEKMRGKSKKQDNADSIAELSASDTATPFLHVVVPTLSLMRKNCPSLVVYRFYTDIQRKAMENLKASNPVAYKDLLVDKYICAKVYGKFLKSGIKRHTVEIFGPPDDRGVQSDQPNAKVVVFTHRGKPFTDVSYKNTKLRWLGTSVAATPYASTSFEMVIQNAGTMPHLADDITDDDKPNSQNELLKVDTTVGDVAAPIEYCRKYKDSTLPIFAQYNETPHDLTLKRAKVHGIIACYERVPDAIAAREFRSIRHITNDTLLVTILAMVLREQESKKSHNAISKRAQRASLEFPSQGFYASIPLTQ